MCASLYCSYDQCVFVSVVSVGVGLCVCVHWLCFNVFLLSVGANRYIYDISVVCIHTHTCIHAPANNREETFLM